MNPWLRPSRLLVIAVIVAGSCFVIGKAIALDAFGPGTPWPGNSLKIYNGSNWHQSVREGVTGMNRVGMNIKLSLVKSKEQADVVISDVKGFSGDCDASGVVGCAHLGYQPGRQGWIKLLPPQLHEDDNGQNTQIVMHELGHVLGLRHRNDEQCHLMSPTACGSKGKFMPDSGCPVNDRYGLDPSEWCPGVMHETLMCSPTREAAQDLIDIYGGKLPRGYKSWCHRDTVQTWVSDCVYPGWVAAHNIFPLELTADRKSCARGTPRWGWEPLAIAQRAARKTMRIHPSQAVLAEIQRLDRIAKFCPKDLCLRAQ